MEQSLVNVFIHKTDSLDVLSLKAHPRMTVRELEQLMSNCKLLNDGQSNHKGSSSPVRNNKQQVSNHFRLISKGGYLFLEHLSSTPSICLQQLLEYVRICQEVNQGSVALHFEVFRSLRRTQAGQSQYNEILNQQNYSILRHNLTAKLLRRISYFKSQIHSYKDYQIVLLLRKNLIQISRSRCPITPPLVACSQSSTSFDFIFQYIPTVRIEDLLTLCSRSLKQFLLDKICTLKDIICRFGYYQLFKRFKKGVENVVGELVVDLQGNPMINDLALFETELEGVSSTDEESGNIKQEISNIIFETDNVRDGVQFGVASSIQEQLIEAFVTFEKNNDVGVNEKEIKMIPPSYSPVSNHFQWSLEVQEMRGAPVSKLNNLLHEMSTVKKKKQRKISNNHEASKELINERRGQRKPKSNYRCNPIKISEFI